jgi:serine/threonine protein kinase
VIGTVVDGFEVVRALGSGGMGEVYLARNPAGELRALKVVRADREAARQAGARFRREVLTLGRLRHPGIIQILDAGRLPSGALYLAMEYVSGADVQSAVKSDGPFAVADALRILVQLAAALAYAHAQRIVHRDLKPSNVILADGDPARAKIIDFGLAKIVADEKLTNLTEDQQVLGSPLYWAPEQGTSAQVGPAADIYALGGLAYFVLTGAPMFKPRPAVALVYAHQHQQPEPVSARGRGELPAGLDELVLACVAKLPEQRPTGEQLVIEFDQLLAHAPVAARGSRPPRLFTSSGTSDMEDAVAAQIRQVALELAAVLAQPTDELERLQNELSDLELELAMLDSEVDAALDPAIEHKHSAVELAVGELRRRIAEGYRTLLDGMIADRAAAPVEAAALYDELDALFARYRAV